MSAYGTKPTLASGRVMSVMGSEPTSESFCQMTALSRSADIYQLSVYEML